MNICNYLDSIINAHFIKSGTYPEVLQLSDASVKKLEFELSDICKNTLEESYGFWRDFKTCERLNNYRGILLQIIEGS